MPSLQVDQSLKIQKIGTAASLSTEVLRYEYLEKRLSLKSIAIRYDVSTSFVTSRLDDAQIPRRSISDLAASSKTRSIQKEDLIRLYFDEGKSTRQVADTLGVSKRTIETLFKEFDIKFRDRNSANRLSSGQDPDFCLSETILRELYENQMCSIQEIKRRLKVADKTIRKKLKEFKIPTRTLSESCLAAFGGRSLLTATATQLQYLYCEKKIGINLIAEIFNTSERSARKRLIHFKIPLRTMLEAAEARDIRLGRPQLDSKKIADKYVISYESLGKIALTTGVSRGTVARYLDKLKISRRSIREYAQRKNPALCKLTLAMLTTEYVVLQKSPHAIAIATGVTSSTVISYLNRYRIPIRTSSEQRHIDKQLKRGNYSCLATDKLRIEEIKWLYEDRLWTTEQIAKAAGISETTVSRFINQHGIALRPNKVRERNRTILNSVDLRLLYTEDLLSMNEIANLLDINANAIKLRLKELKIPPRSSKSAVKLHFAKRMEAGETKGGSVYLRNTNSLYYIDESGRSKNEISLEDQSAARPDESTIRTEEQNALTDAMTILSSQNPFGAFLIETVWGLNAAPKTPQEIAIEKVLSLELVEAELALAFSTLQTLVKV